MPVDYHEWFRNAKTEMARLIKENLEAQREIDSRNQEIAALQQTMKAIAPLAGEEAPEPAIDPEHPPGGMTDSIRAILKNACEPLSAAEIRECLEAMGFDMNSYSNPLATIHTVLRRLTEASEVETTHEMLSAKKFTIPVSKHLAVEKVWGKSFQIGGKPGFIGVGRLRRRSRTAEEESGGKR